MEQENHRIESTRLSNQIDPIQPNVLSIVSEAEAKINNFNQYFGDPKNHDAQSLKTGINERVGEIRDLPPLEHPPFKPKSIDHFFSMTPREFKTFLSQLKLDEHQERKIIEGWLAKRIVEIRQIKIDGIDFDPKLKINNIKNKNKLTNILNEIDSCGSIENWDLFYRLADPITPLLKIAKTEDDFNKIENILKAYNLPEDHPIFQRWSQIISEKKHRILTKDKTILSLSPKEIKMQYDQALKEVLEYLKYSITTDKPMGKINDLKIKLINEVLKIINQFRNSPLTPSVESRILAEIFWPLRLGRNIDLSKYSPSFRKHLKEYLKIVFDKSLRTEAAGFWLEKNLQIPHFALMNTEEKIKFAIHSLISVIKNHPDNQQVLKINVIIDDRHIIKLEIDPTKNIDEQITQNLKELRSKKRLSRINPDDLFSLKQNAYTFGNIDEKSPTFQEKFGHEEPIKVFNIATPFKKPESDDYAIRINDNPKKRPKHNPSSLFMVEPHKALLNFDLYDDHINIAMKFAHKFFDGKPAKDLFLELIDRIKKNNEEISNYPITQETYQPTALPLFEAYSSRKFDDFLSDVKTDFNPTFVYALATAIQANVDHFHFLVAGPDIFSHLGPYSNIQPALISLIPLRDIIQKIQNNSTLTDDDYQRLKEWREKTKEEYQRSKKGLSTPATIAAPAGALEKPLSEISKTLGHKGIDLLTNSQGMFSGLPNLKPQEEFAEGLIFYTAQSDSYQLLINLDKPLSSMGVVGFTQNETKNGEVELVFSVRKKPSQAQREFNKYFNELNIKNTKIFNKLIKSWENLINGKTTLDNYYKLLKEAFEYLPKSEKEALENNYLNFQNKLNMILWQSSQNTLNNLESSVLIAEKLLTI